MLILLIPSYILMLLFFFIVFIRFLHRRFKSNLKGSTDFLSLRLFSSLFSWSRSRFRLLRLLLALRPVLRSLACALKPWRKRGVGGSFSEGRLNWSIFSFFFFRFSFFRFNFLWLL